MVDSNALLAAGNLTAGLWLLVLGTVAVWYALGTLKGHSANIVSMTGGVGLLSYGMGFYLIYWGSVRYLMGNGYPDIRRDVAFFWYPNVLLLALAMAGLILVLSPAWQMVIGRHWRWAPSALILGTLWFFYWFSASAELSQEIKIELPTPLKRGT